MLSRWCLLLQTSVQSAYCLSVAFDLFHPLVTAPGPGEWRLKEKLLGGPQKWLLIDYRADVYILLPIFSRRLLLVGGQRSNNHLSALVHQGGLLPLPLMQ